MAASPTTTIQKTNRIDGCMRIVTVTYPCICDARCRTPMRRFPRPDDEIGEDLWVRVEGAEGLRLILGNAHTHRVGPVSGRMRSASRHGSRGTTSTWRPAGAGLPRVEAPRGTRHASPRLRKRRSAVASGVRGFAGVLNLGDVSAARRVGCRQRPRNRRCARVDRSRGNELRRVHSFNICSTGFWEGPSSRKRPLRQK